MTLLMWRILCVIAAVLFLFCIITLLAVRFLKNKYTHSYTADKVLRTVKATNSRNTIYLTSGDTYKYIKKYVVCKSGLDKYLICNFARKYEKVGFFVVQYNALKRVCAVTRVTETNTTLSSHVIALSSRCVHVNVVISYADSAQINAQIIRPIPRWKIRVYALLKSLAIFAGIFLLRHVAAEIFAGVYLKMFLNSFWNYGVVIASFLFALLGYLITVLCFRRKNAEESNGGAIEYEFV